MRVQNVTECAHDSGRADLGSVAYCDVFMGQAWLTRLPAALGIEIYFRACIETGGITVLIPAGGNRRTPYARDVIKARFTGTALGVRQERPVLGPAFELVAGNESSADELPAHQQAQCSDHTIDTPREVIDP